MKDRIRKIERQSSLFGARIFCGEKLKSFWGFFFKGGNKKNVISSYYTPQQQTMIRTFYQQSSNYNSCIGSNST